MTYAIAACARNEGPFLIEWIAHHLSVGFDKIFVATNDCEDGTDQILDLLAADWPVYRIDNTTSLEGLTHQRSAVQRCLAHEDMTDQDWVMHIDLDEFLNIRTGQPRIAEFLAPFGDVHAVMFGCRVFGSSDRAVWDGGGVLDGFLLCQDDLEGFAQKVMFRRSAFRDAAPHCPKDPTVPAETLRVVNTAGEMLDTSVCYRQRGTALKLAPEQKTWALACINHYMHKSHDLTRLSRRLRGDANGRRARRRRSVGTEEYNRFDRNDVLDVSINTSRVDRIRIMTALLQTPGVLEAHYQAHAWFFKKLTRLAKRRR
ncbi:hypothetical protein So717_04620 [Roseobacter cerasinus]|uniref:Glycosyl transferase family 2 n=1 Tax=Roseobacter cerasinus TaxID=2602289 RepID=A0A640VKV0_9RHOB|nr:glycosyltransferase family 2 protein [Roseobacter cerasinus]GFE48709.1 hypothetical protein So717_04620 [Roseobacter cerasinus]